MTRWSRARDLRLSAACLFANIISPNYAVCCGGSTLGQSPLLSRQEKSSCVSHHDRMTDRRSPLEQPLSLIFHSASQRTPVPPPPDRTEREKQVSSAVIFGRRCSPGIVLVSQKAPSRPAPSNSQIKTACLFVITTFVVLLQLWSPPPPHTHTFTRTSLPGSRAPLPPGE